MAHKQRTPFTLKSGNAAAFKNMGSYSPMMQTDATTTTKKTGLGKLLGDVKSLVQNVGTKLKEGKDAADARRQKANTTLTGLDRMERQGKSQYQLDQMDAARARKNTKKAKVDNVAEKSTPISPSDAKKAMGAFNTPPPEPPEQKMKLSHNSVAIKGYKTYIIADESNNTPSPKVKVRRGALEQQIIKTAEKPGKGIGPWQATKFPKMNTELKLSKTFNTKAATTEKTDKVKTKKVRNKPKPGESQYQADVRVAAEERRASRIAKKEAEQIKLAEPVDLTKQTGLGPRV
jgi:hypothetical protein